MSLDRRATSYYLQRTDGWLIAQLEACTHCGICATVCPFYLGTNDPAHAPIRKIEPLRQTVEQHFTFWGKLRTALGWEATAPLDAVTQWVSEAYYACTACNRCALACPMGIDLATLIQITREGLAAGDCAPEALEDAVHRQTATGSPLGVTQLLFENRLEWLAEEEGVRIPLDVAGAESLVVFTSIEMIKFPGNLSAVARIMDASGESWTLSSAGREAVNFATFSGDTEEQVRFVRRITDAAVELGVRRIILTECGHAYVTVQHIATRFFGPELPFEVENIIETMARFVRSGKIRLKRGAFDGTRITFHDACKLQRLGGIIEEPRQLLSLLAPHSFVEMTPNREAQICCGGGGGVIAIPEADEIRMKAFLPKVEQLENVQAEIAVTACSTCRLQFLDGSKYYNLNIEVRGITEMVAAALDTGTPKGAKDEYGRNY